MASTAPDIFEYVVWLIWTSLTLTPGKLKTLVFATVLSPQGVLEQLLSGSLLVFAPSLLDIEPGAQLTRTTSGTS